MASEKSVKAAGRKWLQAQPYCIVTNIAASIYGDNGIPDTHVNWRGFTIWVEFKAPGRDCENFIPKDSREHLQKRFIENQIAAGGFGFFCSDLDDLKLKIKIIDGRISLLLGDYKTLEEYIRGEIE